MKSILCDLSALKARLQLRRSNVSKMPKPAKPAGKSLPKASQLDSQRQLIRIHEILYGKAQIIIQQALQASQSSDHLIPQMEPCLLNIEKLMNHLSDELVQPGSCSTEKQVVKLADTLGEVLTEIQSVVSQSRLPMAANQRSEFREINKLIRQLIEKHVEF